MRKMLRINIVRFFLGYLLLHLNLTMTFTSQVILRSRLLFLMWLDGKKFWDFLRAIHWES